MKFYQMVESTPWEDWLGCELDTETLQDFTPAEIVMNCLWEMTFYGYTQEDIAEI